MKMFRNLSGNEKPQHSLRNVKNCVRFVRRVLRFSTENEGHLRWRHSEQRIITTRFVTRRTLFFPVEMCLWFRSTNQNGLYTPRKQRNHSEVSNFPQVNWSIRKGVFNVCSHVQCHDLGTFREVAIENTSVLGFSMKKCLILLEYIQVEKVTNR